MTFAPPTIVNLAHYWVQQGGVNLGIVGDVAHMEKGVSYHLGKDDLETNAYSRILPRDLKGLSNAASAIDLGRLDGKLTDLYAFSRWFAQQCYDRKVGYRDIREVIFWSPTRQRVIGWSAQAPGQWINDYGDLTHKTHTHISFFRDSEFRDKIGMFRPYFVHAPVPAPPPKEDDMPKLVKYLPGQVATLKPTANIRTAPDLTTGSLARTSTGEKVILVGTVKGALDQGSSEWYTWWNQGRFLYTHSSNVTDVAPAGISQATLAAAVAAERQAGKLALNSAVAKAAKAERERIANAIRTI